MGGEKQGQGLCPWTPPGSETLDLNYFRLRREGPAGLGLQAEQATLAEGEQTNGVWGRRPQRVQGRALALLLAPYPRPLAEWRH